MLEDGPIEGVHDLEHQADERIAEIRASVRPCLFVISGPSGVGKDSVIDKLRSRLPDVYFAVTATTRPRRPGEIDGVHYFFMPENEFLNKRESGEFIESAEVYGNWYGVPKSGIRSALRAGRHAIVKVDVQGAHTIRALAPEAVLIFIMPPSMAELSRRLFRRKAEGPTIMMRRVQTAGHEMTTVGEFDYVVFNEEGRLDAALDDLMAIIRAEQLRVNQRETEL